MKKSWSAIRSCDNLTTGSKLAWEPDANHGSMSRQKVDYFWPTLSQCLSIATEIWYPGDENDDDLSEEEAIVVSTSDDEEGPSLQALASLDNFISTLEPSKKRKVPTDEDSMLVDADALRTRKRRIIEERTEAGPENEFSAQTIGECLFTACLCVC